MSAGSDVAALAAQDLIAEAAARGFQVNEDEAPATVSDESAAADENVPQDAATETTDDEDAWDTFEIDLTAFKPIDDNDNDDDADDDEVPVVASQEDDDDADDEDDPDEYVDPEVRRLRAEQRKLKKQLDHERTLRVEGNRKKWAQKLSGQYPLADFDAIQASSRRDFERKAQESHNKHAKILAPAVQKLEEALQASKSAGLAEGKKEAQEAWGKPTLGPQVTTISQTEYDKGLEEARKSGSMEKVLRYMRLNQPRG